MPFHFWAPDTYEGAPTPVTAFLSVASKAGGFVALLNIIFFGFYGTDGAGAELWWPRGLGARGRVDDARQPRRAAADEHRPHARLLVDRAGRVHARAVRGGGHRRGRTATSRSPTPRSARSSIYLLVYGAMNLGAFAVVIAVARRTRSAEISTYDGLFQTSPGLAVMMTIFLASLAGIPPLAGWFAKFVMFQLGAAGRRRVGDHRSR